MADKSSKTMATRAVETDDAAHSITRRALQAATALNLITAADITHSRAFARVLGQSNRVALIQCGKQSWIAKHAGGPSTVNSQWRAELAVYRAAPALGDRSLVPALVAHNKEHHVMITEALEQNWTRLDRSDIRSPWSVEIFARVATNLARWHQASQSLSSVEPATPWPLLASPNDPLKALSQQADGDELRTHILGDTVLRASLDEVANSWASSHVMHGDLRLANVMFHTGGPIRLIDWGHCGWGDPRWDLGGLLQELHSAEMQPDIDTSAHRAAVISAYAERAISPSSLREDDSTLQAFVAGRLILRALQLQSESTGTGELVDAHLRAARAVGRS